MLSFRFPFSTMGCPCELLLEADSQDRATAAFAQVQAEVERLNRKYSHFRDDSLVARIGASAGSGATLEVDEETANLLDFAAELHRQSAGLFDITAGALTQLWDLPSGRLPDPESVAQALHRVGWTQIEWQRPRLRLPIAGMRLDLGGIVKEYAADRAAEACRAAGIRSGVIDLGGDLALIGPHHDGQAWVVGIKSPRAPDQAQARIELQRGGLATSGDYERAMIVDGVRYCHIVDPCSGYPVQSFASVSVVADTCLIAGTAATLAMLMGVERGGIWLRELGLPHLCIHADGSAAGNIEGSS